MGVIGTQREVQQEGTIGSGRNKRVEPVGGLPIEKELRRPDAIDQKNARALGVEICAWGSAGQFRVVTRITREKGQFVMPFLVGAKTEGSDRRHLVRLEDGRLVDGSAEWGPHSFMNHVCNNKGLSKKNLFK